MGSKENACGTYLWVLQMSERGSYLVQLYLVYSCCARCPTTRTKNQRAEYYVPFRRNRNGTTFCSISAFSCSLSPTVTVVIREDVRIGNARRKRAKWRRQLAKLSTDLYRENSPQLTFKKKNVRSQETRSGVKGNRTAVSEGQRCKTELKPAR